MEKCQYDELKEQQGIHWWFVGKKEIVLDFAETHAGLRKSKDNTILDVGCGMGLMLDALSEYGCVYGLDMEQEAVDYCNECLAEKGLEPNVKIGSLPDNVPYEDGTFDYIFALDIIEHIENDVLAIKKLRMLLKPGKRLILTVPALMSLWSYNDVLNQHYRRYDKEELLTKIEQAGFHVLKCSYYNSYLYPFAWIVRRVKNALGLKTTDVKKTPKDDMMNRLLKKIFVSEKKRLRDNEFKVGVSLIVACEA